MMLYFPPPDNAVEYSLTSGVRFNHSLTFPVNSGARRIFADEGFLHHERRKADVAFSSLNALRSLLALRAGGPGIALVTFGAFDVADQ
ncbi:MAG: hypothetical protein ACLUA4_05815 [Bifidobacterium sp.]